MKWEYGQKKAAASVFIAWMMSKSASIADEKNTIERGFFWWNGNPKICQFGKQPVCVFCVPFHLGKPLGSKHLWSRKVGSNPSMRPQVAAVDLASSHWVEQFTVMGCEAVGMPPNLSWMGFQIQSWTFRKIESWEGLDFLKKHKWRPLEIFSLPGVYEVWRPRHAPIIFFYMSVDTEVTVQCVPVRSSDDHDGVVPVTDVTWHWSSFWEPEVKPQHKEVVQRRLPGCPDRGGGRTTPSPTRNRSPTDKVLLACLRPGCWWCGLHAVFRVCEHKMQKLNNYSLKVCTFSPCTQIC